MPELIRLTREAARLAAWLARHPRRHMVEPLPASMHTAAGWQPTVIYEHERDKAERLAGTDALMPC